jgi:hypothetical protein
MCAYKRYLILLLLLVRFAFALVPGQLGHGGKRSVASLARQPLLGFLDDVQPLRVRL